MPKKMFNQFGIVTKKKGESIITLKKRENTNMKEKERIIVEVTHLELNTQI